MLGGIILFEQKIKSGDLYYEIDYPKELNQENLKYLDQLYEFNLCKPSEWDRKEKILKGIFATLGKDCYILSPFQASWGKNIHIGNHVYINYDCTIIDDTDVYIGDYTMIGPKVTIATACHPIDPESRKKTAEFNLPIHIDDNVWIGAGAIILPGISIGKNSVIGAGSVVTKDIPSDVVAFGNPCQVYREISEEDRIYYYQKKRIPKD